MSWFGTDAVALACILGSAAVGGAATLAMADGSAHPDMGCGVEAMAVSPSIAISHGGHSRAIIVAPDVRVSSVSDCAGAAHALVEIHMDQHMEQLDAHLEHLDHALEIQLEGLEQQFEMEFFQEQEIQAQLEAAMEQLEEANIRVKIEKIRSGGH